MTTMTRKLDQAKPSLPLAHRVEGSGASHLPSGDRAAYLVGLMKQLPLILLMAVAAAAHADETSDLWGESGERWTPEGRLPDFSYAGYRRGEESYRIPEEQISVKDFGAKGDGVTDDVEAFRQAIAEGRGKVIFVPAGRYILGDTLIIRTGNLVLRGEGMEKTVLCFSRPLGEISPRPAETADGRPTTAYSWWGGLIYVQKGLVAPATPVKVTADAVRGSTKLTLEEEGFEVGDEVVLHMADDAERTLASHLFRGETGDMSRMKQAGVVQVFRIISVSGVEITLDRPLRADVKAGWSPYVAAFAPELTDVGIEELGFEFPAKPYAGHWLEEGWNAIQFGDTSAHCWARNLRIWNADNGIFVKGTFTTLEGIHLGADQARLSKEGMAGHHGLTLGGADCLATKFIFTTSFFHDLGVEGGSIGNVFSKGSAPDMNMDHHRDAPYENLFTDLDMGEGTRIFKSGGGPAKGLHTAAGATFWNLRSKSYQQWPENFGPNQINLVALKVRSGRTREPDGRWLEDIRPGAVTPPDLHLAMLERRLGSSAAPAGPPPADTELHRWVSVDGREIEARFGGLVGDQLTLIRDGRPFSLSLSRLDPGSREQARRLHGGRGR